MRLKKQALVFVTSLVIPATLWLAFPPPAAAGPSISRSRFMLDVSEERCVRQAKRSVSDLREMDDSIRTEVDDDTVWVSNDSFTAMIMCISIRDRTLALIVVASDRRSLAGAMRDSLKRGMR